MGFADELYAELAPEALFPALSVDVIWYPEGRSGSGGLPSATTVSVLLAIDALLGTNEFLGDGAITRDAAAGDQERRTGYIQVPKGTNVNGVTVSEKSLWEIHGKIWTTQRLDATDAHPTEGYEGWRITTNVPRRTSRPLGKGTEGRLR